MVLFGKGCNMSDYIFGRNAVLEALESDRKVEDIMEVLNMLLKIQKTVN